jgi:ribosomal protein L24E
MWLSTQNCHNHTCHHKCAYFQEMKIVPEYSLWTVAGMPPRLALHRRRQSTLFFG